MSHPASSATSTAAPGSADETHGVLEREADGAHADAADLTGPRPPAAADETTRSVRRTPGAPAAPTAGPAAAADLPPDRYDSRELSWLEFNARVLALAEDPSQPLLERAKFLAIFASNLDEFYMVRVAGLKRRDQAGLAVRGADGLTPREQLARISARTQELAHKHARVFLDEVAPALAEAGIHIIDWSQVTEAARPRLSDWFARQVFPVLTPLAVDPAHPFPYISNQSLNLAVAVHDPQTGTEHFARVKVPNNVPRLVRVGRDPDPGADTDGVGDTDRQAWFLPIEDLIAENLDQLFEGMRVTEHHVFRVTRNADLEVEEDRDEDLLQALERELARRRFGPPVRLEITDTMSEHMLELLLRELDVDPHDVVKVPGLLDLSALMELQGLNRPELKDPVFVPATHPAFSEGETPKSVFATLREGDVLVHHPYDSFSTSVHRFIEQAAADPKVLAIKQTLYRTSGDSPIVESLIDAAEAGKQVVAVVEIKARFDERANIGWARALERAGVHVVYGLVGLKTHCKAVLVVRQEGSTIKRYCHLGTGNYNPKTARLYEDMGVFTADETVAADLTDLFNVLTGYARRTSYRKLLVAPYGLRRGIVERIDGERERAERGETAGIRIKVNGLVDEQVIDALYRASAAGVSIDLVVRGLCSLRAGVPGLSENIRVRSVLGRFLEHSRIFHFVGADEYWIGSADMMHRNLDRRVELLVPVTDPRLTAQLDLVLDSTTAPSTRCWVLQPDGSWDPWPVASGQDHEGMAVCDHQVQLLARRQGDK
ncbi:RNA degradosome polyphosphate kinase [Actinomycetospora lemnae]|uniref:Polyphosphate kinase n=1 Tax=Actinomycetospora lemnae TaxID=3019891 RepID=A0ABT5SPJ5_9PSEU|nr:RNA degradosome polyphosphate kinase [Actinomycetospora sp. DW7H6]MDD7964415.1 RNA degradosome polyphosphate kinase [Actinomycetospora sp. DW7H6]